MASSKGPLPDEIVAACEQTWLEVRGSAKDYWLDDLIFDFLAEANQQRLTGNSCEQVSIT